MQRTISSAQTFWVKSVVPPIFFGIVGATVCAAWLGALHGRGGGPLSDSEKWFLTAFWLAGTVYIAWSSCLVKRVQVDDTALYVSKHGSEVRIPLADVSRIVQSRWTRVPMVTIHLRHPSPVGQRIVFLPTVRWALFGTHPIVTELRELCDRANSSGGAGQVP
jgi:hypothetical protein